MYFICVTAAEICFLPAGTPILFYLTDTGYLLRCYYYRTAWQRMVRKHRGKAEILKFYPKKWNEIIVHNLHKNKLDVCKYRILRDLSRELEGKTLLQHMFHAKNIYIIKSEKKWEYISHASLNYKLNLYSSSILCLYLYQSTVIMSSGNFISLP